jgi:hypothetical protein
VVLNDIDFRLLCSTVAKNIHLLDYDSCSGTIDLLTCMALLTSGDLIGFDVERSYSTHTLFKPDHAWICG